MYKQLNHSFSHIYLLLSCCLLVLTTPTIAQYSYSPDYSFSQSPHSEFGFGSFAAEQLKYVRVKQARNQKGHVLQIEMESRGLPPSVTEAYIRVFKKEGVLEYWVKDFSGNFVKFREYTICVSSGRLGPKRMQGDRQVPEGFYYISRFNPESSYYLSLGINYPNKSDRVLGRNGRLGGDIYIHGGCKTAGCVPLTNDKMMEVYWLSVQAKNNGQDYIPVHVFPYKFNNSNYSQRENYRFQHHNRFWQSLKKGYDQFESMRIPPRVNIGADGYYNIW